LNLEKLGYVTLIFNDAIHTQPLPSKKNSIYEQPPISSIRQKKKKK